MRRSFLAAAVALVSAAVLPAAALANSMTSTAPTMSGIAQAGETLTCNQVPAASWTDTGGGTISVSEIDLFQDSTS